MRRTRTESPRWWETEPNEAMIDWFWHGWMDRNADAERAWRKSDFRDRPHP